MLAPSDLERIAEACTAIGNEAADENGFVPVRRLLHRFHACLVIRPLLVEGMLASLSEAAAASNGKRWAVLVDAETYLVNDEDVEAESREKPLPTRLRNTIAHELLHSLAFRPSEFGVQLKAKIDNETTLGSLVDEFEEHTERLSPLLLWPEKSIAELLARKESSLSIVDLVHVLRTSAISRYILVTRLSLLRPTDPNRFLFSKGLRNVAVGLGEWGPGGLAALKGWPVFRNFDGNIVPSFIHEVSGRERVWADSLFPDATFAMCGGVHNTIELETHAGPAAAPNSERMKIEVSVENQDRKPGAEFLFTVRKSSPL